MRIYNILIQTLSTNEMMLTNDVVVGDGKRLWNKLMTLLIASLMIQLTNIKKTNNENMRQYIARVENVMLQLDAVDEKMSEQKKQFYIESGLSKTREWHDITTMIRLVDKSGSWTQLELTEFLISEENSRNINNTNNNNKNNSDAYNFNNNNNNNNTRKFCTFCKKKGHTVDTCYMKKNKENNNNKNENNKNKNNNNNNNNVKCIKCGQDNHKSYQCYFRNKNNNNINNNKNNNSNYNKN